MRTLSTVLVLATMTGCTAFSPPRDIESMDPFSHCETVDCIVDVYDEVITGTVSESGWRWKWMEGYKDTPLRYMMDKGSLTVESYSGWWLPAQLSFGIYLGGYATFQTGAYGDIATCSAHYMDTVGWRYLLVHELMHCQGYMESGWYDPSAWIVNSQDHYTKGQVEEMEKDNVEHWYETEYYKNEDATWHTEAIDK
jgi:hypothetical protein